MFDGAQVDDAYSENDSPTFQFNKHETRSPQNGRGSLLRSNTYAEHML